MKTGPVKFFVYGFVGGCVVFLLLLGLFYNDIPKWFYFWTSIILGGTSFSFMMLFDDKRLELNKFGDSNKLFKAISKDQLQSVVDVMLREKAQLCRQKTLELAKYQQKSLTSPSGSSSYNQDTETSLRQDVDIEVEEFYEMYDLASRSSLVEMSPRVFVAYL